MPNFPDAEVLILAQSRDCVREIQKLVYLNGSAGDFHFRKAQDMLGDLSKIDTLTDAQDHISFQRQLPSLAKKIRELDERAHSMWLKGASPKQMGEVQSELSVAYDRLCLKQRCYEQLVRLAEKPSNAKMNELQSLDDGDQRRLELELRLRMSMTEFAQHLKLLEQLLRDVDVLRDSFAEFYREFSESYSRSITDGSPSSIMTGFSGMRKAVNYFDDRNGYLFSSYAKPWIVRELQRAKITNGNSSGRAD